MAETCQWLLVAIVVARLFASVYRDFNGMKAIEPQGFPGFVGSVIAAAISAVVLYGAGAFDLIF